MGGAQKEKEMKQSHMQRWGVAYLLLGLFVISLLGQLGTQYLQVLSEAQTHGEAFRWSDFWPRFGSSVLENWQSEWAQLLVQAVFVVGFAERMFKKSQEETDQIKAQLERLERLVKEK
jgi:hypothetical protein